MLETLIYYLKKLSGSNSSGEDGLDGILASNEAPLDLARAVLFADLALIDGNFESREYEFILKVLQKDLKISHHEAVILVKTASENIQFRGSHAFATELQQKLTLEQRRELMTQIKTLIHVDKTLDGFEIYLEKKLSDTLGV